MHLFFLLLKPSFLHFFRSILSLKQLDIQSSHVVTSFWRQLSADIVTRKITKILIFFAPNLKTGLDQKLNKSFKWGRKIIVSIFQICETKNLLIWKMAKKCSDSRILTLSYQIVETVLPTVQRGLSRVQIFEFEKETAFKLIFDISNP